MNSSLYKKGMYTRSLLYSRPPATVPSAYARSYDSLRYLLSSATSHLVDFVVVCTYSNRHKGLRNQLNMVMHKCNREHRKEIWENRCSLCSLHADIQAIHGATGGTSATMQSCSMSCANEKSKATPFLRLSSCTVSSQPCTP